MNTSMQQFSRHGKTVLAVSIAAIILAACAAAPTQPAGAADVRAKLTQLQNNPDLSSRAPMAIKDAEVAVRTAEQPLSDNELARHRVYLADRKVDIAAAQAKTKWAEDQRVVLSQKRDDARLDARTREVDASNSKLATARVVIAEQKRAADAASDEVEAARVAAANSAQQAAELQRQLDAMQAKVTDRGIVLTLGDMLFTSGKADLKSGTTDNLNRLVTFLNSYPNRTVMIEGHTDSVGAADFNAGLSQRRANSVKDYLTGQGIGSARLNASGKGEEDPVASNDSANGRQQNRRVDVVIINEPVMQTRSVP